jgi:hypothetical protein
MSNVTHEINIDKIQDFVELVNDAELLIRKEGEENYFVAYTISVSSECLIGGGRVLQYLLEASLCREKGKGEFDVLVVTKRTEEDEDEPEFYFEQRHSSNNILEMELVTKFTRFMGTAYSDVIFTPEAEEAIDSLEQTEPE